MVVGAGLTDLVHDVLERVRAVDGETNEDQISLRVRERSQAVVFLLASRVPEGEFDDLTVRRVYGVGDVVLKDCRDVFLSRLPSASSSGGLRRGGLPRGSILGCS